MKNSDILFEVRGFRMFRKILNRGKLFPRINFDRTFITTSSRTVLKEGTRNFPSFDSLKRQEPHQLLKRRFSSRYTKPYSFQGRRV